MVDTLEVVLRPTFVEHYSVPITDAAPPLIDPAQGGVVGGSDALLIDDGGASYGEVWCIGDDGLGTSAFDLLGVGLEQLVVPPGYVLTGVRWFYRLRYPVEATITPTGDGWFGVATNSFLQAGPADHPIPFQDDHLADGTLMLTGPVFWPNPFQPTPDPPAVDEWFDYWYPSSGLWADPDVFDFVPRVTRPGGVTIIAGNYRGGVTTGHHANSVPQQITQFYVLCQLTNFGESPPRRLFPRPTYRVFPPPENQQYGRRFGPNAPV